jgi:hypothetical protein
MKIAGGLDLGDVMATVLVLAASAVLPNAYVVSGMKLTALPHLVRMAVIPAVAIVVVVVIYGWLTGRRTLARTILWASLAGVLATVGLDVIRLPSTWVGYLPMDEGAEIGMMLSGEPMEDHMGASSAGGAGGAAHTGEAPMHGKMSVPTLVRGYLYHYGNGISFALIFAFLFGGAPWWVGVLYAVFFVDAGMMVAMPMMGMPLRASGWIAALLAHVAYGAVLGVLLSRWLEAPGVVVRLLSHRADGYAPRLP